MGLKKYKGALTYPVGLGILHDCTIFKKWPSMSNACIVMWYNFGQNITTGLFFPLTWVSSCCTSRTLMVLVDADSHYLEKPNRWSTAFVYQICPCGMAALTVPAAEMFNDRARQYWVRAPSHHHRPLTRGLHWAVKFLKYLLKPGVPQAPTPFPHT